MSEPDNPLIAEFNARRSEDAFAGLVRQHVNLVFATALRQVGDAGAAEEITQNVFVALALAAGRLGTHPTIAGWLHQTALNKSRAWLRTELRRRKREQVAVNLELARAEGDSVWSPLVPLLDEALLELREADRQAVILHYMEGRSFQEVGSALGVGEDAVRKRVHRSLGQLTDFFSRHGFATPAHAVGAPLFALTSHVAPVGLATSATTVGLAAVHSAASTSTLTLIKGALKIMAWTKAKTAILAGAAIGLATGTFVIVEVAHWNAVKNEQVLLNKIIAANRSWLVAPPDTVANYTYVSHLSWPKAPGGVQQTPVHVGNPANTSAAERQGITYASLLQFMAKHPELVRVRDVKKENEQIRLSLEILRAPGARTKRVTGGVAVPIPPLVVECGNGVKGEFRGYFSAGGSNAELVLDAEKMVPLSSVLKVQNGTVEETFADFAGAGPGEFVPLSVNVKYTGVPAGIGPMEFAWKFKLHDGLWLLDESQYRGEKVVWTDQVAVN